MASSGILGKYDVFVSFRGDTRLNFTDHLFSAFRREGIVAFRDNKNIKKGESLEPELVRAIEASLVYVVVLSQNFASSTWCLRELEMILECVRVSGKHVYPVFYDVDPSGVRHQMGNYAEAFAEHEKRFEQDLDVVHKWRNALTQVANLSGWDVHNEYESDVIDGIVKVIINLLDKMDLFVADNPVGVESRVEDMIQLLDIQQSNDVRLLGLWGMGGIGKTTIAKAIYNAIGRNFEGRSFLANIREVWGQTSGQVYLQEQLLSGVFYGTKTKIQNIDSGKNILKDSLCHKRVLLVLDDVNELEQLDALCGSRKWFGSGSRIIITTRDMHVLRGIRVDDVHKMKEMNDSESIELFSWHAFKRASPEEDFAEISRNVVKYSGGLPLALEVLGRYLFNREVTEWKCVLEKLKKIPNDKVQKKLKISYDGLDDDYQKAIFLDIACFFIGMDRNDVTHILNGCGFFAENGISVLVERSLVTVSDKNKLGMHDLLRDMGREIICDKPRKEPEERSRLWFHEDVNGVLSGQTGTKAIEGLALKLPKGYVEPFCTKAFKKMKRLRLLLLVGVQLDGDFEYLSRNLKWLYWDGFPLSCIPTSLFQGNLVSIELENSKVNLVWKETPRLEMLKVLNLSHSHYLTHTPDFSNLPNLEKLVLADCSSLSEVSHTIGDLNKILLINLEDCRSLQNLPRSIYKLKSLKILNLSGCLIIDKLEEDFEQMESLTTLIANNTGIKEVPFSVVRSKSIGYISLCGYEGYSHDVFPSIILSWTSPTNDLSSQFHASAGFSSLVHLDVPSSSSHELSTSYNYLPQLQSLSVECSSERQLSLDAAIILDALYATDCKESESTATSQVPDMTNLALIQFCSQVPISGSEKYLKSLLIQMGRNCRVTNILKESILQNMSVNDCGDCLLPGDCYPEWLTFNWEGSSVVFECPQVEGRMLKTIMCVVYYSIPHNITSTSDGLKNMLVINHTRATIQLYKREALTSFENEEWQRLVSNIKPGDKIEVVVVFESRFIVKKTAVYLVYDVPIGEKIEQCHTSDKNVTVCSGDEVEYAVRNIPPQVELDDLKQKLKED